MPSTAQNYMPAIKQEFDLVDNTVGTPVTMLSTLMMVIGAGFLVWMMSTDTQFYMNIALVFYFSGIALQYLSFFLVRQNKSKILGKYGFKCQSCHKIPNPKHFALSQNHSFCLHCQLKY